MKRAISMQNILCIQNKLLSLQCKQKSSSNTKKDKTMTTIERLEQLGAGQYIDLKNKENESPIRCYICDDRHADAVKAIRILKVDGYREGLLIMEVEIDTIMCYSACTEYIIIEDGELIDPVDAKKIKMRKQEVLYSSREAEEVKASEVTIEIEKSWHKATDKIAMTYAQKQYIDNLSNEDNLIGWDFSSTTNAQRSLTKFDASEIIDALKEGKRVIIK